MGGDWYDTIALDDRRMCLVVGDVSGHGAGAVATMTQIRTVVHTLLVGGMTLPDVLVRTLATMQRDGLGYAPCSWPSSTWPPGRSTTCRPGTLPPSCASRAGRSTC